MEKIKYAILSQQHPDPWGEEEARGAPGSGHADAETTFYSNMKQGSGSSNSSDSGYEGKWGQIRGTLCCVLCLRLFSGHVPK